MRTRGKQATEVMSGEDFTKLLVKVVDDLKSSDELKAAEEKIREQNNELRKIDYYHTSYHNFFTRTRQCRESIRDAEQAVAALKQSIMSKVSGLIVDGFDFASIPVAFSVLGLTFTNNLFKNGKNLDDGVVAENCVFDQCEFSSDFMLRNIATRPPDWTTPLWQMKNCVIFIDNVTLADKINADGPARKGVIAINRQGRKPLIAVVYVPADGIFYANEMLNVLGSKDINILKLDSNSLPESDLSDLKHPIANYLQYVDGIYLPGGPNVETNVAHYSRREKLERYLVKQSLRLKIPLLAVCRGHQFVGHYFGADVAGIYSWKHKSDIRIVNESTRLYQMAKKLDQEQSLSQRSMCEDRITLTKQADGYHYSGFCAHNQGVFFRHDKVHPRVKIAAIAADNLPECMEIGGHIITFQHHHAATHERDLFSRSAIAMYADMVKKYHQFKESRSMTRARTGSITATNVFAGQKRLAPEGELPEGEVHAAVNEIRRHY